MKRYKLAISKIFLVGLMLFPVIVFAETFSDSLGTAGKHVAGWLSSIGVQDVIMIVSALSGLIGYAFTRLFHGYASEPRQPGIGMKNHRPLLPDGYRDNLQKRSGKGFYFTTQNSRPLKTFLKLQKSKSVKSFRNIYNNIQRKLQSK